MADISKVKIGVSEYDIKDAIARGMIWKGTQAEYETAVATIPAGTVIFITDDGGDVIAVNYVDLTNKPQINGVTLTGNKTGSDLGLVNAETGKGLSSNDYTANEKSKLAGIASGAQANVIEAITVNGVAQTVTNKTVALTVMTNAVNDLVNYYKKTETYTQAEVNALVGAIPKFAIKVVDALPTTDISTTTVYLLRTSTTETGNLYTEYIYAEVSTGTYQWEMLGTQTLDLSDYVTTSDLNTALANYTTTANLATVATSGSYADLSNTPTLGTAAAKNVPTSGDAATTEVVMGNDSRLSDARTPTSHTHTKSEITDFPTLGTAAAKDVATTGNASTSQVVMGNDTRLTDARNAADVHDWAKASTKPTYTASEVGLGSVVNTGDSATPVENGTTKFTTGGAYTELAKKVDKVTGKGLSTNDYSTTEKNKLAGIAAGAEVNVQADWNETNDSSDAYIQNKPTLGTAAAKNVATSGNASTNEVVMGNDTRLTDSRTPTSHTHTKSDITDFPADYTVYYFTVNKNLWSNTGIAKLNVSDYNYQINAGYYNELFVSDSSAKFWREYNVRFYQTISQSGMITGIWLQCDSDNIPTRTLSFSLKSVPCDIQSGGVTTDVVAVPSNIYADNTLDASSVYPVQNKTITTALNGKANTSHTHTMADISNLWEGTLAEYTAQATDIPVGTLIIITDDGATT